LIDLMIASRFALQLQSYTRFVQNSNKKIYIYRFFLKRALYVVVYAIWAL